MTQKAICHSGQDLGHHSGMTDSEEAASSRPYSALIPDCNLKDMQHSVLLVLVAFRSGWKTTPRATRHQAPGLRQHSGVTDPQQQLQLSWALLQTHLPKTFQASPPTDRREVRSCMGPPSGGTHPPPFMLISGINSRYRHSTACEANMSCNIRQVIICIALLLWRWMKLQTGRMLDRAGARLNNHAETPATGLLGVEPALSGVFPVCNFIKRHYWAVHVYPNLL